MRRLALALIAAVIPGAVYADTPERVHMFMVQWDLDHDGKISLAEFEKQSVAVMPSAYSSVLTPEVVRDTFKAYDLNGDGFITEPEMQEINRRQCGG